jgi:hypothetical protein
LRPTVPFRESCCSPLIFLVLLLTGSAVRADKIKNEFDRQAPFGNFKTYAFKRGLNTLSTNREQMEQFVLNPARRELEARGMQEVNANPDVYLTYFLTLDRTAAASGSLYTPGMKARYDFGIPGGGMSSTVVLKGTLVIEMVGAINNKLAWRGICSDSVKHSDEPMDESVRKPFRNYPPKVMR